MLDILSCRLASYRHIFYNELFLKYLTFIFNIFVPVSLNIQRTKEYYKLARNVSI